MYNGHFFPYLYFLEIWLFYGENVLFSPYNVTKMYLLSYYVAMENSSYGEESYENLNCVFVVQLPVICKNISKIQNVPFPASLA